MFSTDASRTAAPTQNHTSAAYDASELKIIQAQVGHSYASTTGIYTHVSADFKHKTVQRMIAQRIGGPQRPRPGTSHGSPDA
jgi:integrase